MARIGGSGLPGQTQSAKSTRLVSLDNHHAGQLTSKIANRRLTGSAAEHAQLTQRLFLI